MALDNPSKIGFFLVPQFSMIAFTAAIEPLRLANRAARLPLYTWQLYSQDGTCALASNGVTITTSQTFGEARDLDMAFVCAGLEVQSFDHHALMSALRRLSMFGCMLGAVCTGTYVLAKAGLLTGYKCTIHWENHASLVNEFTSLDVSQELFEIDRNRMTCAGGTASLDMMLSLIARDHGVAIASQVSDQLIHHRIRNSNEWQRMDLRLRLGISHPKLLAVVASIESHIDQPVSCKDLADAAQLSTRQLERLFLKYFNTTPSRYYLSVRLNHARRLLHQTSIANPLGGARLRFHCRIAFLKKL